MIHQFTYTTPDINGNPLELTILFEKGNKDDHDTQGTADRVEIISMNGGEVDDCYGVEQQILEEIHAGKLAYC